MSSNPLQDVKPFVAKEIRDFLSTSINKLLDSMEEERPPGCLSKDFREDREGVYIRERFLTLVEKMLGEEKGFVTVRLCAKDLVEKVGWTRIRSDVLFYGYISPGETQKRMSGFFLKDEPTYQTESETNNHIVAKRGYIFRVLKLVKGEIETRTPYIVDKTLQENGWSTRLRDFSIFGGRRMELSSMPFYRTKRYFVFTIRGLPWFERIIGHRVQVTWTK